MTSRSLVAGLVVGAGGSGWVYFCLLSVVLIIKGFQSSDPPIWWMYDWHVHWAGARDFVERDLYRGALLLKGEPLPTPLFNLPPGAAVITLPLIPLGRELGGIVWVATGVYALLASALTARRFLPIPHAWAWMGIALLLYTTVPFFVGHIVLGNVNHLMLGLLTAFVAAYLSRNDRMAGALLGCAIAIKAWPLVLMVLLIREGRWVSVRWAGGVVGVQGVLVLAWLGPDVLLPMIEAMRISIPYDGISIVLWTTWARLALDAPLWLGPAIAGALLAIPARGKLGLGIGLLAGISLINNVWNHYLPTFALALLLIGAGVVGDRRWSSSRNGWRGRRSLGPAPDHPG